MLGSTIPFLSALTNPYRAPNRSQAAVEFPDVEAPSAVTPLFASAQSLIPLSELTDPHQRTKHFTLKYYGRPTPEVTCDFVFLAPGMWSVGEAVVARDPQWPSDHAPIVASLCPRTH